MKDIMQIGQAVNRRSRAAKAAERRPRGSRVTYAKDASGKWAVSLDGQTVRGDFDTKRAAMKWATDPSNADIMQGR